MDVNCSTGGTIASALNQLPGRPIAINVTGPCTENVTITRDDVTLQGAVPDTLITAADSTRNTIFMNGARRIVLANLDVRGGLDGVGGSRGASFDLRDCSARNNSRRGVSVSNQSTGTVHNCLLESNQDGALAVNGANLYITDSTIRNNTGDGAIAVRNSHLRVGQDINGSAVVRPVTITGNASNGVVVSETSVGIIVGGVVENNTLNHALIYVGRASRASIGLGTGNLQAPTIVRNSVGNGIFVEDSATAVIINTTLTGNTNGITVRKGASARIGIDENSVLAGNTITGNRRIGLIVAEGASADIGGNTISANGTEGVGDGYGIGVFGATALLAGGNTIENNPHSGIFAYRGSNLIVGAGFGSIPTGNTIRGNGSALSSARSGAGIFLFMGAAGDINNAAITGNLGGGVRLSLSAVAELRNVRVTGNIAAAGASGVDDSNAGQGVVVNLRSTLRVSNGSDVSGNAAHGVLILNGGTAEFIGTSAGGAISTVNSNGGFGLRCFNPEDTRSGDLSGIGPNTLGAVSAACTGF